MYLLIYLAYKLQVRRQNHVLQILKRKKKYHTKIVKVRIKLEDKKIFVLCSVCWPPA
jgi:hypothetical protein